MQCVLSGISLIKQVICNQSPEQIGGDIGGEWLGYDLRIPFDRQPKGGQHPEFLAGNWPKESLDK